jgi:hypothetical protein
MGFSPKARPPGQSNSAYPSGTRGPLHCAVKQVNYLLARIRGEVDPLRTKAAALIKDQRDLAMQMICQLDWRDFETLIDLIFARGGWQRQSAVGGNQADVDMVLTQPTTTETAWVQVKSRSSQAELDDYYQRFRNDGSFDRFFFIYHSAPKILRMPDSAGSDFGRLSG